MLRTTVVTSVLLAALTCPVMSQDKGTIQKLSDQFAETFNTIIFAPVGSLVPAALRAVRKGGRVVCGGIHMSDIPSFPYRILWGERQVVSVANLTRQDAIDFLAIAPKAGVRTETVSYPLQRANEALADLRKGRLQGAAVLIP
jgi:propanol-preferring alcohol dehydrogenase